MADDVLPRGSQVLDGFAPAPLHGDVARRVDHRPVGHERGRPAAIEVDAVGGAEGQEEVGGLGQGHADAGAGLAAVDGDEQLLAGRVPADEGAGLAAPGEVVGGIGEPAGAVLDEHRAAAEALGHARLRVDAEEGPAADLPLLHPAPQRPQGVGGRAAAGQDAAVGGDRAGGAAGELLGEAGDLHHGGLPDP